MHALHRSSNMQKENKQLLVEIDWLHTHKCRARADEREVVLCAYLQALKQGQIAKQAGCKFFNLVEVQVSELQNTKRGGFSSETHFAERAHITDRQTHNQNKKSERANRALVLAHWKSAYTEMEQNANGRGTKRCSCREIIQQQHCRSAMKRHRKSRVREKATGWNCENAFGFFSWCWIRRSQRVCVLSRWL